MSETRTRFDIQYCGVPGSERLTIKCNFPQFEKNAVHKERTYIGWRAVKRIQIMKRLADKGDALMEKWIIDDCKVGSPIMTVAMLNEALMVERARATIKPIAGILSDLGAMPMPKVSL
jgi:hypothetical protein